MEKWGFKICPFLTSSDSSHRWNFSLISGTGHPAGRVCVRLLIRKANAKEALSNVSSYGRKVFVKGPNCFQRLENNFKPGKYPFTGLLKWLDCVSFSHVFGGSSNNLKDLKESG